MLPPMLFLSLRLCCLLCLQARMPRSLFSLALQDALLVRARLLLLL